MSYRETAYKTLERVAKVDDYELRKNELRRVCVENNNLAIIIQRTYHPNYHFDLPVGKLTGFAKRSNHDEAGPLYNSLRKWYVFRPADEDHQASGIKQHVREAQFIDLYESVAEDDADLLVGIKDKKLPWDSLDAAFIADALPEMFPDSFRAADAKPRVEAVVAKLSDTEAIQALQNRSVDQVGVVHTEEKPTTSKRQQCFEVLQANPGLTRKEYIKLFEALGVSTSTAGMYYQTMKDKV